MEKATRFPFFVVAVRKKNERNMMMKINYSFSTTVVVGVVPCFVVNIV
jgi:hypothetical protein